VNGFHSNPEIPDLTQREQVILQDIIRQYILTANPVGSRTLSRQSELNLGAASIRNIMSDLEEKGLLRHPHTSAGRVPTDRGYRYYVNTVTTGRELTEEERDFIGQQIELTGTLHIDRVVKESSRILSKISQQLAIVSSPHIGLGRLQRIDLIDVASNRIMVIVSITSGIVKTIIFEIGGEVRRDTLATISALLNERLSGLTLREIRETFDERMRDLLSPDDEVVRTFRASSHEVFSDRIDDIKVHIDGVRVVTLNPEFGEPERMHEIIDLIENQNIILHILDTIAEEDTITVRIGAENQDDKLREYSLVAAPYHLGPMTGTLSIIGPRRMNYPHVIALVEYLAKAMSH
jgi:heat-inducible transcriptional repressor